MLPATMLLLPLLGALAVVILPARQARGLSLLTTLAVFVVSIIAAIEFDVWGTADFGLEHRWPILPAFDLSLGLGVDSVSMLLVLLTTFLMPLCVWGSFSAVQHRLREYYAWLLVLEAAMIGVFVARDLIFFYICFELTLAPMFFLIAIYGGAERMRASIKFFIYTFTGSLITLAGLLYVAWQYASVHGGAWTFDIAALASFLVQDDPLSERAAALVLLAMLCGFAVKVPLFPLHTWLPLAHTEAPTAGSVILAGVLLKLGTYGLYRFVLPMVPGAVVEYAPAIAILSIVGIVYAALICRVQTDVKKLVAYSSVSHLGFCVLGLFALNPLGVQGSVLYMINHGLSTGALFLLIGMIYERYHTRDMRQMSGLIRVMPIWGTFMVFFMLSSVGLPGLNGFVSEVLCLVGAFTASPDAGAYPGVLGPWYAAVAGSGMILAAIYLLYMVGKVVWGPLQEPARDEHGDGGLPRDLNRREIGVLVPLAIACVYLGVQPGSVTDAIEGSIASVLSAYPEAVSEHLAAEGPVLSGAPDPSDVAATIQVEPIAPSPSEVAP